MTIAERYAEFAADFAKQPISADILHHAKRAVIDWYAALLPGAIAAPAVLLEKALREELDRGAARLAFGRQATTRAAALINGTAAHTMEVDDIFREAIYHPGAPTIAAALAAAQASGADGDRFLKAVIAGYEISTRIGAAMGRAHYRFWHSTGTAGTFGAAAAAAVICDLNPRAFAHALATAATFAAGLQQAFRMDSMSKPLHAGRAAEAGLLAAMAAREGVTGSLDILEGEAGFGRAMAGGPDWEAALATLGRDFHIAAITFKNHACCGHIFAAIDGAMALQRRMGLASHDIAHVDIATYGEALQVAGNANPATPAEARFSLPYAVATALVHGSVRLAAFEPARLGEPATRDLMRRIVLTVDPGIDANFPARRAARVIIEAKDGRREQLLQQTRKGDPDMPLTDTELEEKYLELAVPVIGQTKATTLLTRLWHLEAQKQLDLY
ncbi:MAG TPA: MmgE/PrpD family protein [Micropepsaceae bacterium]|jgi:2-methylcitrate dehydratase PrpD|nr:MmgE/PrpD family protein [Micropepsaceae bacterium]